MNRHAGRLAVLALLIAAAAQAAEIYPGPYPAEVVRVIDGDTVVLRVRLWPGIEYAGPVRLADVDTPELRARQDCERHAARAARDFVARRLAAARRVEVSGVQIDKYGRPLARVWVDDEDLASALVRDGHGRLYAGDARGAWCR